MQKRFDCAILLLAMAALAFAMLAAHRFTFECDTLWLIKAGEHTVTTGTIKDPVDIYSWICAEQGRTWTQHSWLTGVILYKIN